MINTFLRVLALTLITSLVYAGDEPALVSGNAPYLDASLGESKYVGIGIAMDSGWCFAGGSSFALEDGAVSAGTYVYVQRMLVNKPRFAAGPSITAELNLWPNLLEALTLYLGWQLYYLAWEGVALGVQPAMALTLAEDEPPKLKLGTLALVLSYALPL